MANENHETYGGNDISTYTDDISGSNTFTNEQIESYVLSAGITPYSAPLKLTVANFTHEQCTGGPNLYSPFYKESNSMILWYDESGLGVLESDNKWWYRHHVYVSKTGNKIATSLKVQNYRNFLEIITHTWADIRGTQHKTYYPRITTKYGTTGDWHESVLMPACLIENTTDGLLAKSIEQTEPQSYWYWGGPSNVQNGMGGGSLFTRDLNSGTVTNDSYNVPWEPTGSDPIRIKEGGDDYTFPVAFVGDHITSVFFGGNPLNLHQGFNSVDDVLLLCAFCGLMFEYNGVTYKPLASGGVVYGYTDNMTETSDWDDWRDIGDHEIPLTPPGPPTPPVPEEDPWHGVDFGGTGAGGGGAFCSVYYMTGAQLASLKNWSNTSAPENFDMLPSIIGLQQLPVAVSGVPTTVKFLKSGAITSQGESRVVDTGVAAGTGTGQPISFSLGSIDINRRMQQRGEPYLDYDCTIELFLPFAGTFVLDTQAVMGRTINAEIVIDPVNGTAFAYAWVTQGGQKMPIAYGGSSIAVDLPIASNQWGISRAAFKQISHQMTMNAIKDLGNFIIGLGTFKTGQSGAIADRSGFASLSIQEGLQAKQIGSQMMTSSTINAATDTASSIVNAHQLNNTNYTAVNGSFGGSYAEWSQPFTAYVRITRPKFKKPSNFNHTQAVPCVEAKTLSSCSGLTICINPDCGSISCTEAEKIMITQALVGGVYAGGGS